MVKRPFKPVPDISITPLIQTGLPADTLEYDIERYETA